MRLSIITICFNDASGFLKTADSIVGQTFKDFEWIVIDGGSTDGGVDMQKQYQPYMAYYISEPDKGIYNAMNKGVAHADGEYCLFMNSGDCLCSPKALERIFGHHLTGDIVACDMFADTGKPFFAYNEAPRKINFHRLVIGSIGHQSTLIRTSLLVQTPYREDLRIASDWAFWCEMLLRRHKTYQAVNIPIAVFDMNGVSEAPANANRAAAERREVLCSYFDPEIVDHVLTHCGVISAIDGAYMYEIERKVQRAAIGFISVVFAHAVRDIIKGYKNVKYRKSGWWHGRN